MVWCVVCPWQSNDWHGNEVHQCILCLPVGGLTDLSLDFIVEQGMADGRGRGSGEGGIGAKVSLGGLRRNFTICPSSRHISKTTGNNDKMGTPTASGN